MGVRYTPVCAPLARALTEAAAPLTTRELQEITGARMTAVSQRLSIWRREGLVTWTETNPRQYRMTTPTTPLPIPPDRASTARKRIWTTMRILKRFDVPMVIIASEATRKTVQVFLLDLQRAGLVIRIKCGQRRKGETHTYRLAGKPGPRCPTVTSPRGPDGRRRRVLIDHNAGSRHDITNPKADGARAVNHVC